VQQFRLIVLKTSDLVGPEPSAFTAKALLRGLHELGYVFGEHFVTEPRGSEGEVEKFGVLAFELVREQVDVIVAGAPVLAALQQVNTTIPVVMAGAEDPVGLGLIKSLAHPGTNFTGLSNQSGSLWENGLSC
jgi:putative tryptophan/tyrosine transport system substrate-binding protein